jgi:hypothetical protein
MIFCENWIPDRNEQLFTMDKLDSVILMDSYSLTIE